MPTITADGVGTISATTQTPQKGEKGDCGVVCKLIAHRERAIKDLRRDHDTNVERYRQAMLEGKKNERRLELLLEKEQRDNANLQNRLESEHERYEGLLRDAEKLREGQVAKLNLVVKSGQDRECHLRATLHRREESSFIWAKRLRPIRDWWLALVRRR